MDTPQPPVQEAAVGRGSAKIADQPFAFPRGLPQGATS
jgi:hypothetical protein